MIEIKPIHNSKRTKYKMIQVIINSLQCYPIIIDLDKKKKKTSSFDIFAVRK